MPQPTPYSRQADFSDWSAAYPALPQSGTSLDAEFDAVKTTLAAVLSNLVMLQRDDGNLVNGAVGLDQLNTAVLAMLEAASGWSPRGLWLTATAYVVGDLITEGTATYVASADHTSGTFATDLAAGRWVKIYDSAGVVPGDGTVTSAKIVDGAVTGEKLNITALDLTGTIRAQGGLAAGTAALGELLAAKKASGDVLVKAQRTTAAQGVVGYRLEGVSATWDLRMATGASVLDFFLNGSTSVLALSTALLDGSGLIRSTSSSAPSSGIGAFMRYASGVAEFGGYDWAAAAFKPATLSGSTVKVICNSQVVIDADSDGAEIVSGSTVGGFRIGYRGLPHVEQNTSRVLTPADNGKCIYSKNTAAQTISIDTFANQAIPYGTDGAVIVVTNRGTNVINLDALTGVTMRWIGSSSTGDRVLGVGGEAVLTFPELNVVEVRGTLLS